MVRLYQHIRLYQLNDQLYSNWYFYPTCLESNGRKKKTLFLNTCKINCSYRILYFSCDNEPTDYNEYIVAMSQVITLFTPMLYVSKPFVACRILEMPMSHLGVKGNTFSETQENEEDGVSRVSATTQLLRDSSDVTVVTYTVTSQAFTSLGDPVSK